MKTFRYTHVDLLRMAGFFTLACGGLPLLWDLIYLENSLGSVAYVLWLTSYSVFTLGYWWLTRRIGKRHPSSFDSGVLFLLFVSAMAVGFFSRSGLHGMLLMMISGLLPWFLSLRGSVVVLLLQHAAVVPTFMTIREPAYDWVGAFLQGALYLGFSSFVMITSYVAKQQADAREEQRRLNAELRATRTLLAESSRIGERMRISRDLHDLVGHHLTALSLNLEVASHKVNDAALEHVRQAQMVAKLLLADVREVVSQIREDRDIDLTKALRALVEGVAAIEIHLDMPIDFAVADPKRANVILRCTQEIITNTAKHAKARNLWLKYEFDKAGQLIFSARDDGLGCENISAGNGLSGMRERLAETGGKLSIETAPSKGFALEASIPMEMRA